MEFAGPPRRHQVDRLENLEAVDRADDGREEQRRGDHRQRDLEEHAPAGRIVDGSRFVNVLRNTLKRGDRQKRVIAGSFPNHHQNQCEHRGLAAGEERAGRQSDGLEQVVDRANLRIKQPTGSRL